MAELSFWLIFCSDAEPAAGVDINIPLPGEDRSVRDGDLIGASVQMCCCSCCSLMSPMVQACREQGSERVLSVCSDLAAEEEDFQARKALQQTRALSWDLVKPVP